MSDRMGTVHSGIEAFVIRRFPLGENDRIILFFTSGHGKLRAVAKNAMKPGRKMSGLLEPFNLLEIDLFEKAGSDLYRLNSVELASRPRRFTSDLGRLSAGFEVLGILEKFVPDQEVDPSLFDLTKQTLLALDREDAHPEFVLKTFQFRFFQLAGYGLNLCECNQCRKPRGNRSGYMDVQSGGVMCSVCRSRIARECAVVSAGTLKIIDGLFSFQDMSIPEETAMKRFIHESEPVVLGMFAWHFGAVPSSKKLINPHAD